MSEVDASFFESEDVLALARSLLGMELAVNGAHGWRRGVIVETEAYAGINDRASHAFGGRKTKRNAMMYAPGGCIYMYQCYGIHWMLNIVTATAGIPHAILIRALRPSLPPAEMAGVARGPGKLTQWLGVAGDLNGESIGSDRLKLFAQKDQRASIVCSPRIGIGYAAADALLPFRFYLSGESAVSRPLHPKYHKF